MMPVLFPVGNYFFIGPRYFQDARAFVAGTGVVFVLYWLSITTLTAAVRQVIARFPAMRQTWSRIVTMLLVVGLLTTGLAVFDVWVYSIVPATGVQFSWETVQQVWVLGAVFDILLCTALGLFHITEQWKQNQTEAERLKQAALQQQLDALKGQVNPHFLFNSLSSVSALIGEDTRMAERFVDLLAKVYRYMLQANTRELVPLSEELAFAQAYVELLYVRYGRSIRVNLPQLSDWKEHQVAPLSLQVLIDNAIKHNSMLAESPLVIDVSVTSFGQLRMVNNRQRRTRILATHHSGLSNLIAKYRLLSDRPVLVEPTEQSFSVTLPLLPVTQKMPG